MDLNIDLRKISDQFLCCFPILKIKWGRFLNNISWDDQLILLENTIKLPIVLKYPISKKYQKAFLRKITEQLEQQEIEIHDELYNNFCAFINDPDCDWSYKHYRIDDANILTMKESTKYISEGTTGLCSWEASIALSEWILKNKEIFENKEILELGSGAGLLGFIIAKFCNCQKVCVSDYHPSVLKLLHENMKINFFEYIEEYISDDIIFLSSESMPSLIGVLNLPWENINQQKLSKIISPDIIIAADVVYDDTLFNPLINAINKIFNLKNNDCRFIIASTIRNETTYEQFINLLKFEKFKVNEENCVSSKFMFWDETTPIKILNIIK